MKPAFLVTIDTEGDDLWRQTTRIETRNAQFLPRFQDLCERYGMRPCYLTNYEMAQDAAYQEFAHDFLGLGTAELGMHLHAWNSPPLHDLTGNDLEFKPYLIEYPSSVLRSKVDFLTKLLQDTFAVPVTSHRAGRWAFNETYAKVLLKYGYTVDCSVTPHVDWGDTRGNPAGYGGINYTAFPENSYFLSTADISVPGDTVLLEVPMTVRPRHGRIMRSLRRAGNKLMGRKRAAKVEWLRPRGNNLQDMIRLIEKCMTEDCDYVEFMLHSSELMPGGSPRFPDAYAIDVLYEDIEHLFDYAASRFSGMTLREYRATHD